MKKRWLLIGGIVLAGLVILGVFLMATQPEPVPAVQLKRENVVATLTVTGEVRADTSVGFSPPVSAQITTVNVDEGDLITPGQLLATLETEQVRHQIAQAEEQAVQAQEQYRDVAQGTRPEQIRLAEERYREAEHRISQSQAALSAARSRAANEVRNAQRMRSLFQDGYASEQEYLNAQTQADASRQEVSRLEADLSAVRRLRAAAAAQLEEARTGPTAPEVEQAAAAARAARSNVSHVQARLKDYRIYSTIRGLIVERLRDPGDLATPGQPILRAVKPETLEIVAALEEADIPKVHADDRAYVILDALPETALDAYVRRVGSQVNPQNGTVDLRVVLRSEAWNQLQGVRLMPGMTADVNIVTGRLQDVVVLPATAVRNEGGRLVVYAFRDHRVARVLIRAERISVENFRVISGLQPGDWVAAVASEKLLDKRRVRPVPEESLPKPARPPGGMSAP
jgi:HlyD family secretion protein